jgi:hypothetical protein
MSPKFIAVYDKFMKEDEEKIHQDLKRLWFDAIYNISYETYFKWKQENGLK